MTDEIILPGSPYNRQFCYININILTVCSVWEGHVSVVIREYKKILILLNYYTSRQTICIMSADKQSVLW